MRKDNRSLKMPDKRRLLLCVGVDPLEKKRIKAKLGSVVELRFEKGDLSEETELLDQIEYLSVFIYSHLTREIIQKAKQLKLIATRSTGFDHIDVAFCKKRGITVCNVPFYGENTVAEHTFALILSLSRSIHKAYVRTIKGNFSLEGLQGFDLKGKTLGVVGAGHIGLHVIKMAKGFGMRVVAFDVCRNTFMEEVLGFEYVPLDVLLRGSDIVSLHTPYSAKTHHLINKENIRLFKKGALLINTARGGLVDTTALTWALDNGLLGGAGLDVLEEEELIREEEQLLRKDFPVEKMKTVLENHILLHRENVVITPHIAFDSREALERILNTTLQNIESFLEGKPQNVVG